MAFRYTSQYTPPQLAFGQPPQSQPQSQQQSFNPMQAYSMYQQFAGGGSAAGGSSGLSGLSGLGLGGSAGGLGGSGLIGSAGGATSAASTGGAGFGLGGSLVGGTGTVGGSTFAAGSGGSAAGGAAGGGASALGGAGWFAALAAIIGANEEYQRKKGNREDGSGKRILNAMSGRVVEQDAPVWGEKIDKGNKIGIKGDMEFFGESSTFDFSNAFKKLDETTGGKVVKKVFGGLF